LTTRFYILSLHDAFRSALGIVGVNLCYGAFFLSHVPEALVESLLDKLTTGRVEIDLFELSGIEFRNVDNRIMALKLVQLGLSGRSEEHTSELQSLAYLV